MTAVMMCALAVQNVPVRRGRPSSSSHAASPAFPASTDTSIGFTTCLVEPFAMAGHPTAVRISRSPFKDRKARRLSYASFLAIDSSSVRGSEV
uniref:Uncharacterized protein n=1 Tax=Oryza brachyantha TaxID=4533 RepID=J3NBV8_ORYBR